MMQTIPIPRGLELNTGIPHGGRQASGIFLSQYGRTPIDSSTDARRTEKQNQQ